MRITDLLDKRSIAFDKNPANKQETLDMAVDLMCASGKINDTEAYRKQVYLREEESTTGIGEGIAIPHGKGDCVSKPGLAAMVIKNGVDFDSLDGIDVVNQFFDITPASDIQAIICEYGIIPPSSVLNFWTDLENHVKGDGNNG